MCDGVQGSQRRVLNLIERELWAALCGLWELNSGPLGIAASSLNCCAVSPHHYTNLCATGIGDTTGFCYHHHYFPTPHVIIPNTKPFTSLPKNTLLFSNPRLSLWPRFLHFTTRPSSSFCVCSSKFPKCPSPSSLEGNPSSEHLFWASWLKTTYTPFLSPSERLN